MTSTKIGIVVSTGNAHIRRYIYPDHDAELDHPGHVMPGETIIHFDRGTYLDRYAWQAAVNAAIEAKLGKPPGDPHCCVVDDTNTVVDYIMADPDIDAHPAGHLIVLSYAPIPIGSTYDPTSGLFTSPQITIPAAPSKGRAVDLIVPPTLIPKP